MRTTLTMLSVITLTLGVTWATASAEDFKLEPGFKLAFNGKDLSGWKLRKGGESLEGLSATPKKRFQVIAGELVIDAKTKGNVVIDSTTKFSGDVRLKFEFLPGEGCNNDLYFRGLKFDIKKGDVKNLKPGEWHQFEIVVVGKKVEFKCNGEVQRAQNAKNDSSELGIRAEYGPIRIRHLRYK